MYIFSAPPEQKIHPKTQFSHPSALRSLPHTLSSLPTSGPLPAITEPPPSTGGAISPLHRSSPVLGFDARLQLCVGVVSLPLIL